MRRPAERAQFQRRQSGGWRELSPDVTIADVHTTANDPLLAKLPPWPAPRGGYERALDELRRDLLPGEQVVAGSTVTSEPSRWGAAVLSVVSLAFAATGLLMVFGPLSPSPFMAAGLPLLGLGIQFLPRPMYVAVTNQRLLCSRMPRFHGRPRRPVVAVPLAELRIPSYRFGRFSASIRIAVPGRKPITLHWARARRTEFTQVEAALVRAGAFARSDPPYPV
jgi:hypothetical protein